MADFNLRPARVDDSAAITQLIERAGLDLTDLDWHRFVIVESAEGKRIGCGQIKTHADGSQELASLAVEEAYRGMGVAHRIVDHLLTVAQRPLFLICRSGLLAFYRKFGFRHAKWGGSATVLPQCSLDILVGWN